VLAQVSVEFTILISVLILVLIATIYYNSTFFLEINSAKTQNDAQAISDQIASEINIALKIGDGYYRNFNIPNKISNVNNYNISIDDYFVLLKWKDSSVRSVIMTKNITGVLINGQNIIKNVGGIIYVNQ
jgi:hypothetical protein